MSSRPKIVLLGFDACDLGVVRAMATAGKLPTFRRLLDSWAAAKIRNPYALFVGTLWTSFFTARSAALTGFHCWEAIEPTTYQRRLMTPRELVGRPFWRALGDAGRRVAVLDVPHMRAGGRINGLEVVEYGCHDRHFGFHTSPPELASEILSRIGPHPIFTVEPHLEREFAPDDYVHRAGPLRTADEEKALLREMLEGLERKTRLSTWLLGQGGWDLFVSVFGESHAIGHQQWHLHDPAHPRHDPMLARELGDPVEQVYAGLDRALADHLALVGEESTVLVLMSHGMGPHYDGTHLLEEALARIDAADLRWPRGRPTVQVVQAVWRHLRGRARAMRTPSAAAARHRVRRSLSKPCFDGDRGPANRASRRFFLSPNNSVYGGVRINLEGREPAGFVRPGAELDATCEQLRRDLLALVNVDTGGPVVRSVERTDAHYLRAPMDSLPDLFIEWNHEAPIETVWSPKTGIMYAPYEHWRTEDHRPGGFLLAAGPGIHPRGNLGEIAIGDLGPAICALLGVQLDDVDGRPAPALAGTYGASAGRP
jgi:predicted AlkP superfamily phosphohydrolase/phosphomutase